MAGTRGGAAGPEGELPKPAVAASETAAVAELERHGNVRMMLLKYVPFLDINSGKDMTVFR